jgi:murein DD-endopeptidase MepM/ murein hydrolase activator NlpD
MRPDETRAAGDENPHAASVKTKPSPGNRRLRLPAALSVFLLLVVSCVATLFVRLWPELTRPARVDPAFRLPAPLELASLPTAARFDFPLGSENGAMAYNAQPFTQNRHLGDDLNGIGGENSDFGDPVYAIADGRVLLARDGGPGWGNIVIVLHAYLENGERKYVQSYYAHLDEILVHTREDVRRGQQLATVGNANGRYLAHLHFEMREFTTPFIGPGYREDTRGWLDPSAFIRRHRGGPEDDVGRPPPPMN